MADFKEVTPMTDLVSKAATKLSWTAPELQQLAAMDEVAGPIGALNDGAVEASTSGSPV